MASWKRSLYFGGGVGGCLQAYFAACCVFGQTRYRLERIDRHEDPLDLDGHSTCNGACRNWFIFALPLGIVFTPVMFMLDLSIDLGLARQRLTRHAGISSSIMTSNEIGRVRKLYGIKGSHKNDVVTAVFCPCCSVLRNELEVRTREEEKWHAAHDGKVEKPYSPERPMTADVEADAGPSGHDDDWLRDHLVSYRPGSDHDSVRSDHDSSGSSITEKAKPNGQTDRSIRSNSSLSLNSRGNGETVQCTVVEPRQGTGYQHIMRHIDRALMTPIPERMSEDTMSTAKRDKVCTSPPPQGENLPLGSNKQDTPPAGHEKAPVEASPPLVSRPTSPRKSIDRPGTPIPPEGATSPESLASRRSARSVQRVPIQPLSYAVSSPVFQDLMEDGQVPAAPAPTPAMTYQGQEPFVGSPSAKRPFHTLSRENLGQEFHSHTSTPQVVVQGWLDETRSPARRESVDVVDHAFKGDSLAKPSSFNQTVAPTTPQIMPAENVSQKFETNETYDTAPETGTNAEVAKSPEVPKTTALHDLGVTITDAVKSVIWPTHSETHSPQHDVPITHQPAITESEALTPRVFPENVTTNDTATPATLQPGVNDETDSPVRALDTQSVAGETTQDEEAVQRADQPPTSITAREGPAISARESQILAGSPSRAPNPKTTTAPDLSAEHPKIPEAPKGADNPHTALHDLGATIASAVKGIMPAPAPPTSLPTSTTTPSRRTSDSKIPRLTTTTTSSSFTPDIPPRPPPRTIPTGFPFDTKIHPVPSTPAPPGTFPATPAPAPPTPIPGPGGYPATPAVVVAAPPPGGEAPVGPGGAAVVDRGPFVSFRARQLLGHFLARDTPRTGTSTEEVVGRRERGGRASLSDDERVWGSASPGPGGTGSLGRAAGGVVEGRALGGRDEEGVARRRNVLGTE